MVAAVKGGFKPIVVEVGLGVLCIGDTGGAGEVQRVGREEGLLIGYARMVYKW